MHTHIIGQNRTVRSSGEVMGFRVTEYRVIEAEQRSFEPCRGRQDEEFVSDIVVSGFIVSKKSAVGAVNGEIGGIKQSV
jgi:hypothetical protein